MNSSDAFCELASHGYMLNRHGGIYEPGKTLNITRKLEVVGIFAELRAKNGKDPSIQSVAKIAKVDWSTAKSILEELEEHGRILLPHERIKFRFRGVGILSLDEQDELCLLNLRFENPARTNQSYVNELFRRTGTVVSATLVSVWFKKRFEFDGSFKVPSYVPIDKFKPENMAIYRNFCRLKATVHPMRWKFVDEKHLKGCELYSKRVRADPLTGQVPSTVVTSDFRNTYNIVGFCGCDPKKNPIKYTIGQDNGNAASFMAAVEAQLESEWFNRYDVLVMDNWAGHRHAEAKQLEDMLWNYIGTDGHAMNIFVLYLPTRSPELNPIELIFQTLVRRIQMEFIQPRDVGTHAVAIFAGKVFREMSHELILKTMIHCGY